METPRVQPAVAQAARLTTAVKTEAPSTLDQDDELVLSQLDEKTVKALRVLRRLSPVKKSMRVLLAEHQAGQGGQPEAAPAKKSWWKR
jgi:hypothetical protein